MSGMLKAEKTFPYWRSPLGLPVVLIQLFYVMVVYSLALHPLLGWFYPPPALPLTPLSIVGELPPQG